MSHHKRERFGDHPRDRGHYSELRNRYTSDLSTIYRSKTGGPAWGPRRAARGAKTLRVYFLYL